MLRTRPKRSQKECPRKDCVLSGDWCWGRDLIIQSGGINMANYYCKYCGSKYPSVSSLTSSSCSKSPGRRHELYEGPEQSHYYCSCCGSKYPSLTSLTSSSCSKSSTGRHIPYEGSEKSQYVCQYCGAKYPSLTSLTSSSCSKSPTRRHRPAR